LCLGSRSPFGQSGALNCVIIFLLMFLKQSELKYVTLLSPCYSPRVPTLGICVISTSFSLLSHVVSFQSTLNPLLLPFSNKLPVSPQSPNSFSFILAPSTHSTITQQSFKSENCSCPCGSFLLTSG
jgi:hypothetical protein